MFKGLFFLYKIYWDNSKKYIIISFLEQIVISVGILINIVIPKFIIDLLLKREINQQIFLFVTVFLITNFVVAVSSSFFERVKFVENRKVLNKFLLDLSNKMARVDFEQLESNTYKDVESRAFKFIFGNDGFGSVLRDAFSIFGKLITFIGIVAILATLNIFIVIVFVALVLLNSFVDSKVKNKNTKLNIEEATVDRKVGYFLNILQSFKFGKELRIENSKDFIQNKYSKQLEQAYEYTAKRFKNSFYGKLFSSVTSVIKDIISYMYLIFQFSIGKITIGDFTMYVNTINSFSKSMIDVMESIVNIYNFKPYYDAVMEFFNLPTKIYDSGSKSLKEEDYCIEFVDVSFKYKNAENYSLKDINLKINPKQKYAIVGENGAGKTTFTKLLTRIYEPTSGKILINGVDIKEISYEEYVKIFSVVFQDFNLYSFSLGENVILEEHIEKEREKINSILEEVGFGNKLSTLKNGVDTYIYKEFDDNGFTPSGGEAQKIAIARAIYKDSPFIVLDEPTAALDPRAEYEIYKNFDKLVDNKTAIYISHRLSSARFCDEVLVFEKGQLIEKGSHDNLMEKDTLYKELYGMQSQFYI